MKILHQELLIFLLFVGICFCQNPPNDGLSYAERELSSIITNQQIFLKQATSLPELVLTRQAQKIVRDYESYLSNNLDDTNALILFGKFLRKVGRTHEAVKFFLRADEINPSIAVVKQQIGNYLLEEKKTLEAFPFFLLAVRINPTEPVYHFNLGNFVFLFRENLNQLQNEQVNNLDHLMHESFKEAARLDPKNFNYQLRFAQSFFDLPGADLKESLTAWKVLLNGFGKRSSLENDYINLCLGRIMIDLGTIDDAAVLIETIKSESLLEEKQTLLDNISEIENSRNQKEKKEVDQSLPRSPRAQVKKNTTRNYTFVADPYLKKIKKITSKMQEAKLLNNLRLDVIEARILSNGKISLEFSHDGDVVK